MTSRITNGGERTLPEWLEARASDGDAVALLDKRLGIWQAESWRAIHTSVAALARGLSARGFAPGDRLLVDAGPSPELSKLALAVLRLGGVVVTGEPDETPIRFAFTSDEAARARVSAALGPALSLGIILEGNTSSDGAARWCSLEALSVTQGTSASLPAPPTPNAIALRARRETTQGELALQARALLAAAGVRATQRVFAARGLPPASLIEHVLGAWLAGGFALSFGETAATEDYDRRELGPHVVFATDRAFAGLVARTRAALPSGTGLEARWLARAFEGQGRAGRLARRLLVRRLREVVGFGRLERAIALDGSGAISDFEHLFGIEPIAWPARSAPRRAESAATEALAPIPWPVRSSGSELA